MGGGFHGVGRCESGGGMRFYGGGDFSACGECLAILVVTLHDMVNILGGFGASHVATAHYGVVVVTGFLKEEDIAANVGPALGDASVFLGECHSIANVVGSSVIGGEGEADALGWVVDIEKEGLQFAHIT